MKSEHVKHLKPEIANRILEVEGERCSLMKFLMVNLLDDDVERPSDEEIDKILNLNIGESTYAGAMVEIKRIS